MAHLLVIEDDAAIRASMIRALGDLGHAVSSSPTGMAGLQSALDDNPDLILLDLGLPDLDGHSVLSMLRAVGQVPVIIVTARDDDPSVVKALDAGADDYIVKPFTSELLDARIRAVLRRASSSSEPATITVGELSIDPTSRQARLGDQALDLTRREFDLLYLLASRAGEVVTKREILSEVWRQVYGGGERTVDVHLSWLRRKLGETASEPVYLHSVRGVGIRLDAPPS
ncbi:MAG: response regulator transcription factor [Tetrasphaera sp.]|nr:response regulator transcription factor [Tetrasphaera sp.]